MPHDKIYYENRSTAQVVLRGEAGVPKAGYGAETSRQPATPQEEKQIDKGVWIRTREDGSGPNDPGAKQSTYRPQLAEKHKNK